MVIALTGLNRGENPQPGYAVIRSLRREFGDGHRLVGLVYDPLESGIYADDGPDVAFTMPYPSAGTGPFLDRMDAICQEEPVDVLIPSLDAELEPLVRMRPQLEERGIRICMPPQDAFEARNKHKLAQLAARCGVSTPLTFAVGGREEIDAALRQLGFPLMVKGRYYGAKRAHNRAELQQHFQDMLVRWGGPVLLQQIVHGEEYDLVGLCGEGGGILGWSAIKKTVISAEGKGFGGVTIDDPELVELAGKLTAELKWEGPFELEVLREATGGYSVIEINPRFPAWVDFPSMLGVNLPAALLRGLLGESVELGKCPPGKLFLRHNIELCCDLQDVGTLSGTGSLKRTSIES